MCEINPKRKQFFILEFFTTREMTQAEWEATVYSRILGLEEAFNASGEVRVHIHEVDDPEKPVE